MRHIIISILFVGFTFVVSAQEKYISSTSIFKPDWYIGANAGLNWFAGEGIAHYSLTQDIGLIGRATFGYNFTPVIGLRGSFGYATHHWPDIRNNQIQSFSAENMTLDIMINLSNWWSGYNPSRPFDITVFGGTGYAHRDKGNFPADFSTPIGRGGLQGDIHLSPLLDLNLIGEGNIVNDNYNNFVSGFPYDIYGSILVGLTYHFRTRQKCNCEYDTR